MSKPLIELAPEPIKGFSEALKAEAQKDFDNLLKALGETFGGWENIPDRYRSTATDFITEIHGNQGKRAFFREHGISIRSGRGNGKGSFLIVFSDDIVKHFEDMRD